MAKDCGTVEYGIMVPKVKDPPHCEIIFDVDLSEKEKQGIRGTKKLDCLSHLYVIVLVIVHRSEYDRNPPGSEIPPLQLDKTSPND